MKRVPPSWKIAWVLPCLVACGGRDGGSAASDDGGHEAGPTTDCDDIGKSQPVSAACCLGHGIDACGPDLFCAVFDGRTQASCYVLGTRENGEECGADAHCASGICDDEKRECSGLPIGSKCTGNAMCDVGLGTVPAQCLNCFHPAVHCVEPFEETDAQCLYPCEDGDSRPLCP